MHMLLMMTFLGIHGRCSWSQRVRHSLHSRSFPKDCKTLAAATSLQLEVIMEGSSKMKNLAPIVESWDFFTTFLHQELLNRMV